MESDKMLLWGATAIAVIALVVAVYAVVGGSGSGYDEGHYSDLVDELNQKGGWIHTVEGASFEVTKQSYAEFKDHQIVYFASYVGQHVYIPLSSIDRITTRG